ncbi:hypothetical protein DFJ73DRAFT_315264 [Zopfochytrium polystomum]|nr:hypothetical protein DFJ73DRAFT_315264 [Zopfochytrium polystomum]
MCSYRHGPEDGLAVDLFDKMKDNLRNDRFAPASGGRTGDGALHPFLDVKCLSYGEDWEVNFVSGLFHSEVIVLLCSDSSMARMKAAHERPDNMLLEVRLAPGSPIAFDSLRLGRPVGARPPKKKGKSVRCPPRPTSPPRNQAAPRRHSLACCCQVPHVRL